MSTGTTGWDKKRGEGREGIDGEVEEDRNKQANKQKGQATLLSQEVLSNPLQVVYFNQLKKA